MPLWDLRRIPNLVGKPMETLLHALISLAMRWLDPRHNAQLQFLREQIRILRARVDAERGKVTVAGLLLESGRETILGDGTIDLKAEELLLVDAVEV